MTNHPNRRKAEPTPYTPGPSRGVRENLELGHAGCDIRRETELIEALAPLARLGDSYAVKDKTDGAPVLTFKGHDGIVHALTAGQCRAACALLARIRGGA